MRTNNQLDTFASTATSAITSIANIETISLDENTCTFEPSYTGLRSQITVLDTWDAISIGRPPVHIRVYS